MDLHTLSVNSNMHKKLGKAASSRSNLRTMKGSYREQWRQRQFSVGCWNIRTLVEAKGPIETSVARPSRRGVAVDRKVSLMERELKNYEVSMTGISEIKWFGQAVYELEGYTILHSGRPVPEESPRLRSEGVGIVLNPAMGAAWREAGEEWKAVSPRVIKARMKMGKKQSDGARVPLHTSL